jgi:hypothetical protein
MAGKAGTWEPTLHAGGPSSAGYGKSATARRRVPSGACVNTGESGLKPQPLRAGGHSRRPADSLRTGRSTPSRVNGTNGLPPSSEALSHRTAGSTEPTRHLAVHGGRRESLQWRRCTMGVAGAPIVLNAGPVTDPTGGRGAAHLGETQRKGSCKMIEACDALAILPAQNRTHPSWLKRGLSRLLDNPSLSVLASERLKSTPGTMTRGPDGQTLEGFSLETIHRDSALRRTDHDQPTPVRRTYRPKASGPWRP